MTCAALFVSFRWARMMPTAPAGTLMSHGDSFWRMGAHYVLRCNDETYDNESALS